VNRVVRLGLLLALLAGLLAAVLWRIAEAVECAREGGAVIAPMMRGQDCLR
jgi:hypothetical protein